MSFSRRTNFILLSAGACLAIGFMGYRWLRLDAPLYGLAIDQNPIVLTHSNAQTAPRDRRQNLDLAIRNVGRNPFRIKSVETTCSCSMAGKLTGEIVPPGGVTSIPVRFDLPASGKKETRLTITTDREEIPPAIVKVEMSGPAVPIPQILDNSRSFQFVARTPEQSFQQEFEIIATEECGQEPWLLGMTASIPAAQVKLLKTETLSENHTAGYIQRKFHFELHMVGPASEDEIVTCWLKAETRTPPVNQPKLPTFRSVLAPEISASSEPKAGATAQPEESYGR